MSITIPFDNTYANLPEGFFAKALPTPVKTPNLIAFNADLAKLLGINVSDLNGAADVFSGNQIAENAAPIAQLYAGHQFGSFNPQLGDGRAHLLGEVVGSDGVRRDIQLKGSGQTPFSRAGDGRAWMGPVLREYVISEAMHALGIPTTRALAAVSTGETIYRDGAMPGAILTRVASSHLRVGTFQVFAHRGLIDQLKTLTDYAIARHHPDADGPMGLLRAVCQKQADLIAAWMSVGFIHGVMNTDNCTISGETIDYGPCAFMDAYHEARVYSSIDQMGRYAFGNQPRVIVWNMAQFATALIQQCDDKEAAVEEATEIVHAMPGQIEAAWLARFGRKIGLAQATDADQTLIEDLLALMQQDGADFTNTFNALSGEAPSAQFLDQDRFAAWSAQWNARLAEEVDPLAVMRGANPQIIPRNHQIEKMIAAAVAADMVPFERLQEALAQPFDVSAEFADLQRPPTDDEIVPATFCGT